MNTGMKLGPTIVLRAAVAAIGLVVLALCVFALPAGIASDKTGLYKPILAGLYVPAIPFFYALYQAMKLIGYIEKDTAFSNASVETLRRIKLCALTICGLFAAGMPVIFNAGDKDDAPGVVAIALIIIFASFVIATFAAVLQRLLANAMAIKSENDLTV